MIWFDWLAAAIVVALTVRGYVRGLILQISAVVAVATGLLGGLYLHSAAAALLPDMGHPVLKLVAGFTVVFVAVALCVNFLARALKTAVDALFLGIVDRLLGAVLGAVVALQLLLLVVLLVGRYLPDGLAWLETSRTAPLLSGVTDFVLPLLPDHFREFFEAHGGVPGDWLEPLDGWRQQGEQLLDGVRRDAI